MLWVEKDLAAAAKAGFDQWDSKRNDLCHQELVIAGIRTTYGQIKDYIEQSKYPTTVEFDFGGSDSCSYRNELRIHPRRKLRGART